MKVYGREINFLRTVEATIKIADLCPEADMENIGKLFDGTYQVSQTTSASFMAILSEGFENHKAFEEPDYKPNPLRKEEALSLSTEDFNELFGEAVAAFMGEKPTVEADPEPVKKTKKAEDKKSSSTEPGSSSTAES